MSNIDKHALRERYTEKPAPKCHICGSVMTIQRAGAGGIVYGCTGRIDKDGEGYKFAEGRDFADDHYARSRVTVTDESDPDVLALLDELEAKDQRLNEILKPNMLLPVIDDMDEDNLRHVIKTVCENYSLLHAKWESEGNRADAAEKRIAEQRETLLAARSYVMQCARMGDAHANGVLQAIDRAAMLQGAEPVSQPCTLPDGYCVMPLKLTSENGAKGALSGEFHVTNRIVCQSCAGEGCEDCNDEGGWDAEIPVSWDTIKRIHEAAVEACSLPAAPQQEVKP